MRNKKPSEPDTPITIDATMLDEIVKVLAKKFTLYSAMLTYNNFTSNRGTGSMGATVSKDVSTKIKAALEEAFADDTNPNAKATYEVTVIGTEKTAKTIVTITLKGNNAFADDVKTKYTVDGKTAKLKLTITTTNNWNTTN